MYIMHSKKASKVLQKPCKVCGEGLGDATQQEWGGQSTTGGMVVKVAGMLAPPITMIPGISKVTGILNKAGFQTDPLNLAITSFPLTAWAEAIPGFNKLIGGLFKKATHMESCMNWWTDSNIRGMVVGIVVYPIDLIDPIVVMGRFADSAYEYRLEHATEAIEDVGIKNVLAGARSHINVLLSSGQRQNKMGSLYVNQVRGNPDVMMAQCASMPQGQAETGANINPADVSSMFGQLKELARQQEYEATTQAMINVIEAAALVVGSILAPYIRIVGQKTNIIQQTRGTGLVVGPQAFQLPIGVTGISKGGAVVLTTGKSSNLVLDYGVIRKK